MRWYRIVLREEERETLLVVDNDTILCELTYHFQASLYEDYKDIIWLIDQDCWAGFIQDLVIFLGFSQVEAEETVRIIQDLITQYPHVTDVYIFMAPGDHQIIVEAI